jgi:hypothetical protein
MITTLLVLAMLLVIAGFAALAVTGTPANLAAHPRLRWVAMAFWWVVLIGGWMCFATGGFSASAWDPPRGDLAEYTPIHTHTHRVLSSGHDQAAQHHTA